MVKGPDPGESFVKIAPQATPPLAATTLKTNTDNELNPAKQAKAAETPAKGAAFGHAVAEFAHARNAARFEAKHGPKTPPLPVVPPIVETPPVEETPPTDTVEETPPTEETVETPPAVVTDAPPVLDPALAIETQLLADLAASSEPGDTVDILA
jgi:hypothetical protein